MLPASTFRHTAGVSCHAGGPGEQAAPVSVHLTSPLHACAGTCLAATAAWAPCRYLKITSANLGLVPESPDRRR